MKVDRVKFAAELARSGLKSRELAQRAAITPVTMSAVKTGKSCSPQTLNKVASALGVPLRGLLADVPEG